MRNHVCQNLRNIEINRGIAENRKQIWVQSMKTHNTSLID